jgi:hypothetical protein
MKQQMDIWQPEDIPPGYKYRIQHLETVKFVVFLNKWYKLEDFVWLNKVGPVDILDLGLGDHLCVVRRIDLDCKIGQKQGVCDENGM